MIAQPSAEAAALCREAPALPSCRETAKHSGVQVFLHPSSALHKAAPELLVYSQLVQTDKRIYMSGEPPTPPCSDGLRHVHPAHASLQASKHRMSG